jgi:nicotinamide-nucleotide amidase
VSGGLALIMIGDELLDGRSRDTNSEWIIERAGHLGWRVDAIEVIRDGIEGIASAMVRHAATASAVVVSGGLGPTSDDLTRDALASALGAELVFDDALLEHIETLFRARGRRMPDSNRRQAFRTPSSRVIENPVGSASGLLDEIGGTPIVLLPGVPAELKAMFDGTVVDALASHLRGGATASVRIRTTQIAESALVELVESAVPELSGLDVAWCVSTWGVDLLIREGDAQRLADVVSRVEAAAGRFVYGQDAMGLPEAVIARAAEAGETLAVAESCTGGMVGAALTSVPGSSAVFLGGVIAYANEIKENVLGVPKGLLVAHGAVSEEVASAMAAGVRQRFGADWSVSTTGIAGPGGGTTEKPVGTVCVGLAGPDGGVASTTIRLGGDRSLVRRWSVACALDGLRRGEFGRR